MGVYPGEDFLGVKVSRTVLEAAEGCLAGKGIGTALREHILAGHQTRLPSQGGQRAGRGGLRLRMQKGL